MRCLVPTVLCVPLSLILASSAAAQGWLDTARWYVQPQAGEFHYVADIDGDGFDDAVWFAGQPGSPTDWTGFRVHFNDGRGDLVPSGHLVLLPVTPGFLRPVDIDGLRRLGDVTGDGLIDVLVLEEPSGFSPDIALHVYPGLGGGAFGAPLAIPLVGDLDAIALGQVDGDAALELAIVEQIAGSESTRWWDWNGAGFTPSAEAFIFGGIVSPRASFLVATDLDLDGDDDLVFGQESGLNLRVLDTRGGAPVVGQILTVGSGSSSSVYPYACDLAGGGAVDLLVAQVAFGSSSFALIPVLNQGGTLVASPAQALVGEGSMYGQMFDTGDWDADGDLDVLVFAWPEPGAGVDAIAAFLENDGSDRWSTAPVAKVDLRYAGPQTPLGLLDLDQDGHLDVLGPQSAFFGRGRFEDSLVEVTNLFYEEGPVVVLDHEGDGDADLFHRVSLFSTVGFVKRNDGTGAFPATTSLPAAPSGKLLDPVRALGDFTGDGLVDFLVPWNDPPGPPFFYFPVFDQVRLYADDGLGGFTDAGTASETPIVPFARKLCLASDVDGDGDVDVFDTDATLVYRPNDGAGHFLAPVTLVAAQHEVGAVADLDADGDDDLLVLDWPDGVAVEEQVAPLAFVTHAVHESTSGVRADSLTLADVDLDGDLDAGCGTLYGDSLLLFENGGGLAFTLAATLSTDQSIPWSSEFSPAALLVDDIDGDGVTDLLAGAESTSFDDEDKVALFRGAGAAFAFEPVRWYVGSSTGPAADIDGDGDLDLTGQAMVRSRRFDGAADGIVRQYGTGTAATSGVAPLLGAAGPLRPGSASAELRVRRGVGGKLALLLYSLDEAAIPGQPFASSTLYVQPPYWTLLLVLGGTPGAQGQGALDLSLTPVLPVVAGITVYHQLAVFGGAGNGKTASNGLQLTYGM
ncbi:MAG: VCBS repeat-containing protein [Planctomycetes bacterium]|nr:VCBS repeat-containing protein [Planctomycetota bacterium]